LETQPVRDDLWLWREGQDSLVPLAQSGHDSDPEWSPNGKYIAFISSRSVASEATEESKSPEDSKADADKEIGRVCVISLNGGDAFPLHSSRLTRLRGRPIMAGFFLARLRRFLS
jgi:dipeptidyl aminopeptidase/acylaminoacyl peptidase